MAVAAWTASGVQVAYLLLTRGEAGMDSSPPERTAELRTAEQIAASRAAASPRSSSSITQMAYSSTAWPCGATSPGSSAATSQTPWWPRGGPLRPGCVLKPGRSPGRGPSHARCPTRRRQPLGLPGAARRGPAAVVGARAAGERRSAAHAWCGRHRRTARTWHCFPGGARPIPGRAPRAPPAPADDHRQHGAAGTGHGRTERGPVQGLGFPRATTDRVRGADRACPKRAGGG